MAGQVGEVVPRLVATGSKLEVDLAIIHPRYTVGFPVRVPPWKQETVKNEIVQV